MRGKRHETRESEVQLLWRGFLVRFDVVKIDRLTNAHHGLIGVQPVVAIAILSRKFRKQAYCDPAGRTVLRPESPIVRQILVGQIRGPAVDQSELRDVATVQFDFKAPDILSPV